MWKWVVRDYFAAFRWERSKEWLKNVGWSIFYFGILMPVSLQLFEEPELLVIYACITFPILFGLVLNACHTMALPKVMYLCPLTDAERREYIEKSCIFRIGFATLLGCVGALIPLVLDHYGYVETGVLIFDSFAFAVTLCGFDRVKLDEKTKERFNQNATLPLRMSGMIEVWASIATGSATLGLMICLCWDTTVGWWVKWIFVGMAVLIQLPLTIRLLKNWDLAIARAASYEESFL